MTSATAPLCCPRNRMTPTATLPYTAKKASAA